MAELDERWTMLDMAQAHDVLDAIEDAEARAQEEAERRSRR